MIVRPEWYFRAILISWRLWAIGFYTARKKNWKIFYFAIGPFRIQFVSLVKKREKHFKPDQLRYQLRDQLGGQIYAQLGGQLHGQIRETL